MHASQQVHCAVRGRTAAQAAACAVILHATGITLGRESCSYKLPVAFAQSQAGLADTRLLGFS